MFLWSTSPAHRIHWSAFQRIEDGMTFDEVVAILGVSPGDYTTAPVRIYASGELRLGRQVFERIEAAHGQRGWVSDAGAIAVSFDANGMAAGGAEYVYFVEPWTFKLRRWFLLD